MVSAMVGRSRVLGLERAYAPGAVACLVLGVGACFAGGNQPEPPPANWGAGGSGLGGLGFGAANAVGGGPLISIDPIGGGATGIAVSGSHCVPAPVTGRA